MTTGEQTGGHRSGFEYHDGRSPAAWTGSIGVSVAFVILAVGAMIGPAWPVIWVGAGVLVASLVATLILQANGYGRFGKR